MLYHMYLTNKNENGRADHVGVVKVKHYQQSIIIYCYK